ncbi:MAG: trypsin-like peptidase domain-containing protein, partial [Acidobacteria bacterium]|nr:trypsin-like peptidase domain-containing protein [Acidobacteriota bacterium]
MTSSVVQIRDRRGRVIGAGVACEPRGFVLTCYHVFADAIGIPRDGSPITSGTVPISVPGSEETVAAELVLGSPLDQLDLALLRVDPERMLRGVVPRPLCDIPLNRGLPFRCYGFPAGYDDGVWAYGSLQDALGWQRFQAEVKHLGPGFSGAPAEELQMGRVVGLMSAHDPARAAGFVITVAQIRAFT